LHTKNADLNKMMYLKEIEVWNFKNYEQARFHFDPQLNIIVGKNGSGKTTILDAIHYLCLSQSAFQSQDSLNVRHNEEFFFVKGTFVKKEEKTEILCAYQNKRKSLQANKQAYAKLSEHIGLFPCVLVTPNDTDLVREDSESRRRFFDTIFCQIDADYLQKLMFYKQLLKNRNILLKQFYERNYFDALLLERFDKEIIPLSVWIAQKRQFFLEKLMPFFVNFYDFLTEKNEKTSLIYQSDALESDFEKNYRDAKNQDLAAQRTTLGIHKDDYIFELKGVALRKFGSQGQQKSFVLALKMAHFQLINQEKNTKALLLLDDIFDKLDDSRLQALADWLSANAGQVFITDAHPDRSLDFFGKTHQKNIFRVENGQVLA